MTYPNFDEFKNLASQGNLIPVYHELNADMDTPVSVYLKLRGAYESFLLESVEGGEQLARYSFIGVNPSRVITIRNGHVTIRNHTTTTFETNDPLNALRDFLAPYHAVTVPGLPRFFGGAVGFLTYDLVRYIEHLPRTARDELDLPDAIFLLTDTLIAFDQVKHRTLVIANAHIEGDIRVAYDDALARIENIVTRLKQPVPASNHAPLTNGHKLQSNVTPDQFAAMVKRAQEHIAAGDIFQVVLSQRFSCETEADAFSIYRSLRRLNPSPYMFLLDFRDLQFIGSSPEVLVRLEDDVAQLNPIAGTRRRGKDENEDAQLEAELFNDPKERAEHVMLVDLGRNDLGRVCEYGSVHVPKFMTVERFSHVMHIVSRVIGKLRREFSAFDLLRATFPAGTVSGAPKVRAMEIIEDLEGTRRGPYAGAVGYFGFPVAGKSNMDFCITIRTLIQRGKQVFVQAGAGIVADSDPLGEHHECENKARALVRAVEIAEQNS